MKSPILSCPQTVFWFGGVSNHQDPAWIACFLPNHLNVILLERGDFKFFTDSLNNKFPYMVRESLNVLHSEFCL